MAYDRKSSEDKFVEELIPWAGRKVPDEDSVAEKDRGEAPCEDEMSLGRQETVTSLVTSILGRILNFVEESIRPEDSA